MFPFSCNATSSTQVSQLHQSTAPNKQVKTIEKTPIPYPTFK
uniref:Uncharacterized protein n=1 Tax=Rhizophora mucronata TaxID=61149 RepID=A0A2P2IL37_RHIMU